MGANTASLTVLLTNLVLDWPSGTVIYTRDLALELQRLGHRPIVYTWLNGQAGRELAAAGVEVMDDLWRIRVRPDVIHGHHRPLVRGALLRFPDVPAVVFCHNPSDPWDAPAPDQGIRRYFGVSELCRQRLLAMGAPADATSVRPNFVDLRKFASGPPLPRKPSRALIFNNYTTSETNLPAIREAAARAGIPLDVIGRGVGNMVDHPENILADYDLVFAVGKAALEAMAVGSAVVLCDTPGLGPMVTSENFAGLRARNFGLAALTNPVTPDRVEQAMSGYDPVDAARVRAIVRQQCGLELAAAELVAVYGQVIAEAEASRPAASNGITVRRTGSHRLAPIRYRAAKVPTVAFYRTFGLGPRRVPGPIRPAYVLARAAMRRVLGVR